MDLSILVNVDFTTYFNNTKAQSIEEEKHRGKDIFPLVIMSPLSNNVDEQ